MVNKRAMSGPDPKRTKHWHVRFVPKAAAVSTCSELFDHLISAGEHFEAEYFASLEGL